MTEWKKGPVDISPEDAGYDASKLPMLEAHYGTRIDAGKIQAASFLMARGGKVFAHQAAGRLTYKADSKPFTVDSLKGIASITKTMTATAVMKLVEDGALWLEQPVKEVIKEFDTPMHGGISVRHLLTHTSGLAADGGYFTEPYPLSRREAMGKDDWLTKGILAGPLQSKPGKHWAYCSMGFTVLAEIVNLVSGIYFAEFIEKKIFKPLGMTRSFFEVPKKL
jgi:CubicO group peptidase (beta-lactamase class C family)